MHACIHAYIHTYMRTYIHTYTHTYVYLYIYISRYTYIYIYIMGAARFPGPKLSNRFVKRRHWRLLWHYMPQTADDRCSKQNARFSWFYYHQTSRKHHAYKNGNDTSIHIYIYRYLSTYRYVLWKNCWLQVLCVYGTYPSLHIKQQKTTRTWKQTRQTAETIQFGRRMPKYGHFFYEILCCIEPMNIREKF